MLPARAFPVIVTFNFPERNFRRIAQIRALYE